MYEPGAFDICDDSLRATELATFIAGLARGECVHPALGEPGWWRRPERLLYPPPPPPMRMTFPQASV